MTDSQQIGIGSMIGGFKIEKELGRGGMGVVYMAHELSLNRKIALKLLSERLSNDEEFIERFKREARVVAALNHPNIVNILSYGEEHGLYYFAMEYVKGTDLGQILKEKKEIPLDQALSITAQVADALEEAAARGVVHRDLKPSNIMIDSMERVKVTDFGIAYFQNAEAQLTRTGLYMGTPEYSSPEQARGATLDVRSDIFSLGAVLYKMLSGVAPVSGESPLAVVAKILTEPIVPISQIKPSLPQVVSDLVDKMIAKDIDARFQSPGEVLEAIKVCVEKLGEEATLTRRILVKKTPAPPPVPQKNNRAKTTGIVAGIILAILLSMWSIDALFRQEKQEVEPEPKKEDEIVAVLPDDFSPLEESVGEIVRPPEETAPPVEPPDLPGKSEEKVTQTALPSEPDVDVVMVVPVPALPSEVDMGVARVVPVLVLPSEADVDVARVVPVPAPPSEPDVKVAKVAPIPALPEIPVVLLIVSGDESLVPFVRTYLESIIVKSGLKASSIAEIPVLTRKMQMGDLPFSWHDVQQYVPSGQAHILLLAEVQKTGSMPLSYYGRTQILTSARVSVRAVDMATGVSAASPGIGTVKFTPLNMDEEMKRGVHSAAGEMGAAIRRYWREKLKAGDGAG